MSSCLCLGLCRLDCWTIKGRVNSAMVGDSRQLHGINTRDLGQHSTCSQTSIGRGLFDYTGSSNQTRRTREGPFHPVINSLLHGIEIQFSSVLGFSLVVYPQATRDWILIPCNNEMIKG